MGGGREKREKKRGKKEAKKERERNSGGKEGRERWKKFLGHFFGFVFLEEEKRSSVFCFLCS